MSGIKLSRLERKVLDLIANLEPCRTLELGPGRGALSAALASLGFQVDALDIAPENFAADNTGIELTRGNLDEPLPYADSSFDLVVTCEAIEHLEHQYSFARELARVLAPGGTLVITTPNIVNAASRLRFMLTGFYALAVRPSSEFTRNRYIEHIYPITFWQLRHILHTSGLLIQQVMTDHIRKSSMLLAPLWPLSYLVTGRALASEPDPRQYQANRDINRQIHSPALFFGRTQIIVARRGESTYEM